MKKGRLNLGDLTPREQQVLDILRDRKNWRPPTLQTIGILLGISHPVVFDTIKRLRRKQKVSSWDYTPIEWLKETEGHTAYNELSNL